MSKKILILAPIPFKSGTQLDTYLRIKATAFADTTNEIDLITFPYGEDVKIPNLNIIRFPKIRLFKSIMPGQYIKISIYTLLMLLKFCLAKKDKYDIIFLYHTLYLVGWILKPFVKSKFISTIYTNLETESIKWNISGNSFLLNILRKYDIFSNSHYDNLIIGNELVIDTFSKIKRLENKIIYIPYAYENPIIIQSNYNIKRNLSVLYSGVFHKIQNLEIIFEAFRLLHDDNIIINLVGASEEEKNYYEQKINKYGIKNINIHRWVKNEELKSFFENADVLISSRTEGIDYPMKIFEYLSYGKCILASNKPIHTGILKNETACLFEPTPEDLAEKILFLKKNPEIVKSYGEKAYNLYKEKYSFERMVKDYSNLLKDIISNY